MDVPNTTHLAWTGKSGVQGSFWGLPQSTVVFPSTLVSWTTKTLCVGPTGLFTRSKPHNLELLSSLSNSICRHKGNVQLLRNIRWYILPVASMCILLNQTYILTANLKYPPCQHTKYKLHKKSTKFTSNSKILNTSQMSQNFSPCIKIRTTLTLYYT